MVEIDSHIECRSEAGVNYVSGLIVPWDQQGSIAGRPYAEIFRPGAFDAWAARDRISIPLRYLHDKTVPPIGVLVATENRDEGQWGDFKFGRTPLAVNVYTLLSDKVLSSFSPEFHSLSPTRPNRRGAQGEVTVADLYGTAVVEVPVYDGAKIMEVREAAPRRDAAIAWLEAMKEKMR